MKYRFIALSLTILSLTACNLDNIKDSKVQKLAAEKNVPELINAYINKSPTFGTDQAAEALGDLGDPKAIEPLAKLLTTSVPSGDSSVEIKARAAAAIALGKLKDARAIKPLSVNVKHRNPKIAAAAKAGLKNLAQTHAKQIMAELLPAFKKDDAHAVAALGMVGQPVLAPMLEALKDPDGRVRTNAASVLVDLADPKSIEPLKVNLSDPISAPMVAVALDRMNWMPTQDEDKVYLFIAKRQGEDLRRMWPTTKAVLLKDLGSDDPNRVDYALSTFIGLGGKDTQSTLIKTLQEQGNQTMALSFLNCGEPTLTKAAEDWATERGFQVVKTQKRNNAVKWGSF
jgi:hypothetical protein